MAGDLFRKARSFFIQAVLEELENLIADLVHQLFNQIRCSITPSTIQWALHTCIQQFFSITESYSSFNDMLQFNYTSTTNAMPDQGND